MHIFKYSMRSGTPAAAMPDQIDPQIKERRAKQMADVAQKNKLDYERRFIGQTLRITDCSELELPTIQLAQLPLGVHHLLVCKPGITIQVRSENLLLRFISVQHIFDGLL